MTRYATTADLQNQGLPPATLEGFTDDQMNAVLDARSSWLDGYLGKRFALPLTAWDAAVRMCVAHCASWDLIVERGFVVNDAWDQGVLRRFESAERWAEGVASGKVVPVVTDSTPDVPPTAGVRVSSRPRRGWND